MSAADIKAVLEQNPFIDKNELFQKANLIESRGKAILDILIQNKIVIKDTTGRTHLYALAGAVKPEIPEITNEEILAFGAEKTFSISELEKAFPTAKDLRERVGALVINGTLFHNDKTRGRRYSASQELIEAEKEADRRG